MLGCFDGNGLATTISASGLTSIGTGANTSGNVFPSWGGDETAYRSLYIADFPYLNNLSFPALKTIGGNLVIELNRYLLNIDFPELADVTGDIYIHGNYTSLSITNLQNYGGNLNVQSSSDLFTCPTNFQPNTVKDTSYVCKGGVRNLTDAGGRSAASRFQAPGTCILSAESNVDKRYAIAFWNLVYGGIHCVQYRCSMRCTSCLGCGGILLYA
jgi:hypothetical protein